MFLEKCLGGISSFTFADTRSRFVGTKAFEEGGGVQFGYNLNARTGRSEPLSEGELENSSAEIRETGGLNLPPWEEESRDDDDDGDVDGDDDDDDDDVDGDGVGDDDDDDGDDDADDGDDEAI